MADLLVRWGMGDFEKWRGGGRGGGILVTRDDFEMILFYGL